MSYSIKLVVLRKKYDIDANLLGKGQKGTEIDRTEILVKITTFIWGATWFVESISDNLIKVVFKDILQSYFVSYIGIIITSIGLLIFILAMVSMKTSWRVGIDKKTKSKLITQGIYKYSRNPAFVGFDLMFLGLFFTYSNLLTLSILVINLLSIHKLILQEERHLQDMLHEEYKDYKNRTPRYLFFLNK